METMLNRRKLKYVELRDFMHYCFDGGDTYTFKCNEIYGL